MLSPNQCGIIFDNDGVIVNSTAEHFYSFNKLGGEVGYTITEEQFKHLFGRQNKDIFPILFGHPLSPEEIAHLSDRKEEIFREAIRAQITPLPGVCELVPALKSRGFHLAIGSSTPRANLDLILGTLNLLDCFDAIVSAEDVSRGKPDPQVFLCAAERLGVPPAHCVVLEDAVAGVEAAKRGGMKALAVTSNHSRQALHEADRIVDTLAELTPDDFLRLIT
ncbi:MAG: HAD family hydrolase [Armatimonadota bacterium]